MRWPQRSPARPDMVRVGWIQFPFWIANIVVPLFFVSMLPGYKVWIGVALVLLDAWLCNLSLRGSLRRRVTLIGLQYVVMVVMGAWFNVGFFWMCMYPASAVGLLPKDKHVNRGAALLIAGTFLADSSVTLATHQPVSAWAFALAAIMVGFGLAHGMKVQRRVHESRESLRKANETIEHLTKLAERERISRDLHDVMGHELSVITLKAQLAERLLQVQPEQALTEIRDIQTAARQALAQVREYIADIRTPRLLQDILRARDVLQVAGMACDIRGLNIARQLDDLTNRSSEQAGETLAQSLQTAALCVREAVTNIVKHSHAKHVEISVRLTGMAMERVEGLKGQLEITVMDDGQGFSGRLSEGDDAVSHNGLRGLSERLHQLHGGLTVWSNGQCVLGDGTCNREAQPRQKASGRTFVPGWDGPPSEQGAGCLLHLWIPGIPRTSGTMEPPGPLGRLASSGDGASPSQPNQAIAAGGTAR